MTDSGIKYILVKNPGVDSGEVSKLVDGEVLLESKSYTECKKLVPRPIDIPGLAEKYIKNVLSWLTEFDVEEQIKIMEHGDGFAPGLRISAQFFYGSEFDLTEILRNEIERSASDAINLTEFNRAEYWCGDAAYDAALKLLRIDKNMKNAKNLDEALKLYFNLSVYFYEGYVSWLRDHMKDTETDQVLAKIIGAALSKHPATIDISLADQKIKAMQEQKMKWFAEQEFDVDIPAGGPDDPEFLENFENLGVSYKIFTAVADVEKFSAHLRESVLNKERALRPYRLADIRNSIFNRLLSTSQFPLDNSAAARIWDDLVKCADLNNEQMAWLVEDLHG